MPCAIAVSLNSRKGQVDPPICLFQRIWSLLRSWWGFLNELEILNLDSQTHDIRRKREFIFPCLEEPIHPGDHNRGKPHPKGAKIPANYLT